MKSVIEGIGRIIIDNAPTILVALSAAAIGFVIEMRVRSSSIEHQIASHIETPAHDESANYIKTILKDIVIIKESIKTIKIDQKKIEDNLNQKLDLNSQIISEKITNLKEIIQDRRLMRYDQQGPP